MAIHTGVGHTDSESAQPFWLGKTKFFLCSWRDLNPWPLDLQSNALTTEPTCHPICFTTCSASSIVHLHYLSAFSFLSVLCINHLLGGCSCRALEFKSEDPGFDPLAGQGERQFFYPSESNLVPDPPSCARYTVKFVRTLKIPYPSVIKE